MRALPAILMLLVVGAPLSAHPVPKDNHDRTIVVRATPTGVVVEYRLEVAQARAYQDLPLEERAKLKRENDLPGAFLRHMAEVLAANLDASLDGGKLDFRCSASAFRVADSLLCDYRFEADWKLEAGRDHAFAFVDRNYPLDTFSALHLALDVSPLLKGSRLRAPDDALLGRALDERRPGDSDRLRRASATIRATPESFPGRVRPALPPQAGVRGPIRPWASKAKPPGSPWGIAKAGVYQTPDEPAAPHGWRLLDLLLDTRQGLAVLLLLAALFGAAHALTPGHGKTMVAAYLIGERGTVWHAVFLGVVTTLTHTSSVIVLALVLPFFLPSLPKQSQQAALGLVGGLLIAATGFWLLMQRLAGRADHTHPENDDRPGWWQLVVLGISGGLVPCWDAILMLGWAVTVHRLWLGLPLVAAFSAGLASVLVAVGIAVVKARESLLARRQAAPDDVSLGRWDRTLARLGRVLPVASALAILGIGLWLCFASAHGAAH